MRAQDPIPCPFELFHAVVVDGIWFDDVYLRKHADVGSNIATYNVVGTAVSRDGRWQWQRGGVTLSCYVWWVLRFGVWVGIRVYPVLDSWGPLVPIETDGGGDCDGGGNDDPPMDQSKAFGVASHLTTTTCDGEGGGGDEDGGGR